MLTSNTRERKTFIIILMADSLYFVLDFSSFSLSHCCSYCFIITILLSLFMLLKSFSFFKSHFLFPLYTSTPSLALFCSALAFFFVFLFVFLQLFFSIQKYFKHFYLPLLFYFFFLLTMCASLFCFLCLILQLAIRFWSCFLFYVCVFFVFVSVCLNFAFTICFGACFFCFLGFSVCCFMCFLNLLYYQTVCEIGSLIRNLA